jgi:hypothetical protein
LFRFRERKAGDISFQKNPSGATYRIKSPRGGISTLITSAPKRPR